MKKIIFLLEPVSQPRYLKRVDAIYNAGYNISVYGLDDGLYSKNIENKKYNITTYKIKYKNRIIKMIIHLIHIIHIIFHTHRTDIIYAFEIKIAFITLLFHGKNRYIYEEGDLNYTKIKNKYLLNIFKYIDKTLIKNSTITVLTSNGFVKYLYQDKPLQEHIIVIPNKLNILFKDIKRNIKEINNIESLNFGFVGLIRYPNTIIRFAKIIGKYFKEHTFYFFGEGPYLDIAINTCSEYSNVVFKGSYKNPDDLLEIYAQLDINVVCYDATYINVRIAEPNKLYESIFFGKPILVSDNTYLSSRINELDIGFSLDASNDDSIIAFINTINLEQLNNKIKNTAKVPLNEIIDSNDYLLSKLSDVFMGKGNE